MKISRAFLLVILIATVVCADPETDKQESFHLSLLDGEWAGTGEAVIPMTKIPISLEGEAIFKYDSSKGYLWTSIIAKKFFFSYADSGHLYHDPKTDSIIWEVWDGFGKYGKYHGKLNNRKLKGTLVKKTRRFDIEIDFVTDDSLTFYMTSQKQTDEIRPRANIILWRVKK
ncbi:MAG: hypothetical protein V3V99_04985 [candidate division Zixibacteria bacterium]